MKIRVLPDWLDFLGLGKTKAAWAEALLAGRSEALADGLEQAIPPASPLAAPVAAYLREKAAQIAGRPAEVLELSQGLSAERTNSAKPLDPLSAERLFLRGFAFMRLGREIEADACFHGLPAAFRPRIQAERALLLLNRGELAEAEALFRGALEQGEFDPYGACTLLGGLGLSLLHQGDFAGAEQCIRARKKVLRAHPSPVLSFGTNLYEILLSLERNDYHQADLALEKSFAKSSRESVNGFFLLHLELRLRLARNQLAAADETLAALHELRQKLAFPEGVLDFRLEDIEGRLRARDGSGALARIEKIGPPGRDQFLAFRLSMLRAQALALLKRPEDAFAEIQNALEVGEAKRYRPGLSLALLHAAGIALGAGHPMAARLFLGRGRQLASSLRLPVHSAGFAYITDVLEQRFSSSSALLGLARHREIGPELETFLDAYGLLDEVRLSVSSPAGKELVAEPRLRRRLFGSEGLFWFQRESVLLAHAAGGMTTVEFPAGSSLTVLFRLLWADLQGPAQGLRLPDVHRARSTVPYREHLHASAAKMLLSRLRARLAKTSLAIAYQREEGIYRFATELPAYTLQSAPKSGAVPKDRKAEILGRIAMEPFVATALLCEEFGVSRQALHPHLQALTRAGHIRLVKRGPISGYVLVAAG